ncbi:MAG: M48 family metallopeptidase, partial [Ilumatobacteraceae bacterium]|nr:M48 family metallopeptidase [Ilumatobacteraceae bacterium]
MFELIRANKRRSVALIASFVLVLCLVGAAFGLLIGNGVVGTLIALVFSGAMAFFSYWKADAIALKVSRARPADPVEFQRLHNLVEGLCIASGLPKPRVFIVDDPAPNAFATGRDPKHAAIAVTTGLLEKLNRVELEGVLAHELSHIRNYDILVSTLAVTLVGSIALLTNIAIRMMWWNGGRESRDGDRGGGGNVLAFAGFALLIFAPLIARVMQATISRKRETLADVSACQLTRYPPGLISALEKLRDDVTVT